MNFHKRPQEELDLNLTPLIDVVFLLLIFFMVSTTFERESEISIQLPEAVEGEISQQSNPIVITIDAQGNYFINQREVINRKAVTLRNAIRDAVVEDAPHFIVNADRKTPHQAVVTAMDSVAQLGYSQLTFATLKSEQ